MSNCCRDRAQALQFLALERKGELAVDDITQELCPALCQQLVFRLCTTAWDDSPGAGGQRGGGARGNARGGCEQTPTCEAC